MEANQVMIKMVLDRWYALIEKCDAIFDSVTDEQLHQEIAPGRNRGIYVLGHLIAVHDDMMPLLGFGDKLYPELYEPFLKFPDKSVSDIHSAATLRAYWKNHNQVFTQKLESLQPGEWFEKHNAVSAEDFLKEPHRNKLNILITRTSHLSYHYGQLAWIG